MQPLYIVARRAPDGFAKVEDVFRPEELAEMVNAYKRTAGFDVESLNSRPSLSVNPRPPGVSPG